MVLAFIGLMAGCQLVVEKIIVGRSRLWKIIEVDQELVAIILVCAKKWF